MVILCHKDVDRVEDKVFKIFKQDIPSTSAEIFYEASAQDFNLEFLKNPSKSFHLSIQTSKISVKSFLR